MEIKSLLGKRQKGWRSHVEGKLSGISRWNGGGWHLFCIRHDLKLLLWIRVTCVPVAVEDLLHLQWISRL